MSRSLELPEQVYEGLQKAAAAAGRSMAEWIADRLADASSRVHPGTSSGGELSELSAQVEQLRKELRDSYTNRAIIYWFLYDELRRALGSEQAEALMGQAIYRRGEQKGKELYRRFAPNDLAKLREAFVGRLPDRGRLFQPELLRADADALDIKFHACPLREAWQEMELSDTDAAALCRIASRVDYGTFQGAGFRFWADAWQPGGEGCCFLHIRPGDTDP
ncbi:MAG TPA: L-2-amino-thiazoline-4-carboxylic acid hydrolase [Thermoguttaceae bacterium]|nr:L-2-amino-thiazoline-4-carboxylic acid hydrolase [Thermoguttaceae bacterium]